MAGLRLCLSFKEYFMWYLLEHKDSKGTMFFDELSDFLFYSGWRIKREAKASEVNIFEYDAIKENLSIQSYE
jgi:hypothetical protein